MFFDELGPPWPKHPCTDRTYSKPRSAAYESFEVVPFVQRTGGATPAWAKDGWTPFVCDANGISRVPPPNSHCPIRGQMGNQHITLYVNADFLPQDGLYHVRKNGIGRYDVSVVYMQKFSLKPTVKVLRAFTDPYSAG